MLVLPDRFPRSSFRELEMPLFQASRASRARASACAVSSSLDLREELCLPPRTTGFKSGTISFLEGFFGGGSAFFGSSGVVFDFIIGWGRGGGSLAFSFFSISGL